MQQAVHPCDVTALLCMKEHCTTVLPQRLHVHCTAICSSCCLVQGDRPRSILEQAQAGSHFEGAARLRPLHWGRGLLKWAVCSSSGCLYRCCGWMHYMTALHWTSVRPAW